MGKILEDVQHVRICLLATAPGCLAFLLLGAGGDHLAGCTGWLEMCGHQLVAQIVGVGGELDLVPVRLEV